MLGSAVLRSYFALFPLLNFIYLIDYLFACLFKVHGCFVYMCICVSCSRRTEKGIEPSGWELRLLAAMWVLGIEPESSEKSNQSS